MIFAHDTEVALASAAALVNTGRGGKELLPGLDALDRFVADWGWSGGRARDPAELDAGRRLRPPPGRVWGADTDPAAGAGNTPPPQAGAPPPAGKQDSLGYHPPPRPPTPPHR